MRYEITLLGREKGSAKVKVKSFRLETPEKVEEFIARMPGGFEMSEMEDTENGRIVTKEGLGVTKGIIKSGGTNALYFENLKDEEGDNLSKTMRTNPIARIVEIVAEDK